MSRKKDNVNIVINPIELCTITNMEMNDYSAPEYKDLYPMSEIVGNANVLIMPGQHSAAISYKIMKTLGDVKGIGPLLIGLGRAIEVAPLRSSTSDILNLASVAAYSAGVINYGKIN